MKTTNANLIHQHRSECDTIRQELTADIRRAKNDLDKAREQIAFLESLRSRLTQADTDNRRYFRNLQFNLKFKIDFSLDYKLISRDCKKK